MTERVLGPTGNRRRTRLWLLVPTAALAVFAALFVASGAIAVTACATSDHLTNSKFEIDAIVPPAAGSKKNALPTGGANTKVDGAASDCLDWNAVSELHAPDGLTGSGDEAFGQGTSENDAVPTIVTDSIPPNKSDLTGFGVYQENEGTKTFVAVYWTRINSPQGTTDMDFEFNKLQCTPSNPLTPPTDADCSSNGVTPTRSVGDKLLLYDLDSGGTAVNIHVRTWDGTQWSAEQSLSSATALGSIDYTAIPSGESSGLGSLDSLTFGEAIIDFNALLGGATCGDFGSVYLKSRSSTSFSAEIKDFVRPIGVNLSNCTELTTTAAGAQIGNAITDTAFLSGATSPTGAVTFNVYTNSSCTSLATNGGNIAGSPLADGDNDGIFTSTASYMPTAVGDYYWTASFAGDANNAPASQGCDTVNEKSTVTKRDSNIATKEVLVPNDSATIGGGGTFDSSGTVTFQLFRPDNATCSSAAGSSSPVSLTGTTNPAVSGASPQTVSTNNTANTDTLAGSHANAIGTWHWKAVYSGDLTHNGSTSDCVETFSISH
jgi:hypothetical protein